MFSRSSNLLDSRPQHYLESLPQGADLFLTPAQCFEEGLPISLRDSEVLLYERKLDPKSTYLQVLAPDKTKWYISLYNLKARLYQLTHKFVFAHHFTYYKQYRGDLRDLVSDFYYEFLTPKSRRGPQLTLIDRYDYRVTSFEYYVKQAVIRKLIDQSRQNPYAASIDSLVEEHGDLITRTYHLVAPEADPDLTVSEEELAMFRNRFYRLSSIAQQAVKSEFEVSAAFISSRLRSWFQSLFEEAAVLSHIDLSPLPKAQRPQGSHSVSELKRSSKASPVRVPCSVEELDEGIEALLKLIC